MGRASQICRASLSRLHLGQESRLVGKDGMERAVAQEVWEPDTGGCEGLVFPKPDPPCWKKPPPEDGGFAGAFDAGSAGLAGGA